MHPNIVGFRGLPNTQDGRTALVMEVCDTSLGDMLEARHEGGSGPLEAKRITKVRNLNNACKHNLLMLYVA